MEPVTQDSGLLGSQNSPILIPAATKAYQTAMWTSQVSSCFTPTVQCKQTTITEICRLVILYSATHSEWFRSYSNILYTITGAVASPTFTPTTYSKHTVTSLQQPLELWSLLVSPLQKTAGRLNWTCGLS